MISEEILEVRSLDENGNLIRYTPPEPPGNFPESTIRGEKVLCDADVRQVKTEICYSTVCPPLGCIDLPYPCIFSRVCTYELVLVYYYPSDYEDEIKRCIGIAAIVGAAAALPYILVGNYSAALEAGSTSFTEAFKSCISEEIYEQVNLNFNLRRRPKESGGEACEWRRA